MKRLTVVLTISSVVTLWANSSLAANLGGTFAPNDSTGASVFNTGGMPNSSSDPTATAPSPGMPLPGANTADIPVMPVPGTNATPNPGTQKAADLAKVVNTISTLSKIAGIASNPKSAWGLVFKGSTAPSAFTTSTMSTAILSNNIFNLDKKTLGTATAANNLINSPTNYTPASATADFSKLVRAISGKGETPPNTANRQAASVINEAVVAGQGKVTKETTKEDVEQIQQSSSVYNSATPPASTLEGVEQMGTMQATMGQGINTLLAQGDRQATQNQITNEFTIQQEQQRLAELKEKDMVQKQAMDVYNNSTK
jgi:hypothetical protein